jgi:hypothetical protein
MYNDKLKTYKKNKNLDKIMSNNSNLVNFKIYNDELKDEINDIYIITILLIVLLKYIYTRYR